MGRAIPLRDALRVFRRENREALPNGPDSEPAIDSAEAVWEVWHTVDP